MAELGDLVVRSGRGDSLASTQLFEALYAELHGLAERQLRRSGPAATLSATTLLHEAFLALSRSDPSFPDRAHFMGYAAKVMRGLIIDYMRARRARKRGGDFVITLIGDQELAGADEHTPEADQIADSLERIGQIDPPLAQLIDLHFFCGFTFAEIATFRGVSERTVQRDWRKARILLEQTAN